MYGTFISFSSADVNCHLNGCKPSSKCFMSNFDVMESLFISALKFNRKCRDGHAKYINWQKLTGWDTWADDQLNSSQRYNVHILIKMLFHTTHYSSSTSYIDLLLLLSSADIQPDLFAFYQIRKQFSRNQESNFQKWAIC